MLSEPVIRGVLHMADEMLTAGVQELRQTPENEDALETVARIYTAMELVRLLLEHMIEQQREDDLLTPEERAKRLN